MASSDWASRRGPKRGRYITLDGDGIPIGKFDWAIRYTAHSDDKGHRSEFRVMSDGRKSYFPRALEALLFSVADEHPDYRSVHDLIVAGTINQAIYDAQHDLKDQELVQKLTAQQAAVKARNIIAERRDIAERISGFRTELRDYENDPQTFRELLALATEFSLGLRHPEDIQAMNDVLGRYK